MILQRLVCFNFFNILLCSLCFLFLRQVGKKKKKKILRKRIMGNVLWFACLLAALDGNWAIMYLKSKSQMVLWVMTTKLCHYLCPGVRHPDLHFASHVFWQMIGKLMPFCQNWKDQQQICLKYWDFCLVVIPTFHIFLILFCNKDLWGRTTKMEERTYHEE